jgi:hypothetical protein
MNLEGGEVVDEQPLQSWTPRPDPTVLTTEALNREIATLRMLLSSEISALRASIDARIGAIDEATRLRLQTTEQFPDLIKQEISHLLDIHDKDISALKEAIVAAVRIHDERFGMVELRFTERDTRMHQSADAAQSALQAALLAAKELVNAQGQASTEAAGKSEASITKQIDQIGMIIQALEKAVNIRISEIKERIDRGEGVGNGALAQRVDSRAAMNIAIAAMGLIFVIISIAFAIYTAKK